MNSISYRGYHREEDQALIKWINSVAPLRMMYSIEHSLVDPSGHLNFEMNAWQAYIKWQSPIRSTISNENTLYQSNISGGRRYISWLNSLWDAVSRRASIPAYMIIYTWKWLWLILNMYKLMCTWKSTPLIVRASDAAIVPPALSPTIPIFAVSLTPREIIDGLCKLLRWDQTVGCFILNNLLSNVRWIIEPNRILVFRCEAIFHQNPDCFRGTFKQNFSETDKTNSLLTQLIDWPLPDAFFDHQISNLFSWLNTIIGFVQTLPPPW